MNVDFRSRTTEDEEFLRDLFASGIAAVLDAIGPDLREATLATQWRAHETDLRTRIGVDDRILVVDGLPIGRVILAMDADADVLVDIAILASARGRGIGTVVLGWLTNAARSSGRPMRLKVAHGNRAATLYSRAGFTIVGASAVALEMQYTPPSRSPSRSAPVPAGYLPVRVEEDRDGARVVFAHAGRARLDRPFFSDAIASVRTEADRSAPLRRDLAEIIGVPAPDDAIPLTGIVFHVSRCGSSLVTRAAQADPGTFAVSEADPIDAVLTRLDLDRAARVSALRAIVGAYARRRDERTRRLVLKLDAWHLVDADLVREAFPDVPTLVVLRDPASVIASHRARRGSHVVPGLPPSRPLAIDPSRYEPHDLDRYASLVLERLYLASSGLLPRDEVRFVDHVAIDRLVLRDCARFLGCEVDAEVEAEIDARARENPKEPGTVFDASRDGARRDDLPETTLDAVRSIARPAYDTLIRGIATADRAIASRKA